MEYPFSPREKGISYWASSQPQMEDLTSLDGGIGDSILEDSLNNLSDLMNFDNYAELCGNSSPMGGVLPTSNYDQSIPGSFDSFSPLNYTSNTGIFPPINGGSLNGIGNSSGYGNRMSLQQTGAQSGFPLNSSNADELGNEQISYSLSQMGTSCMRNASIPRPLEWSLAEKMLRALSLFKESSGGGILAQLWVPIKHGDDFILSTCDQPYLLDQMLAGYREVSRAFTFPARVRPGSFLGLPGRVFISRMPEWTSNVAYYSKAEYLRVKHAVDHEVRGSLALPIFNPQEQSCCAVLELVTMNEKSNFGPEMESVCRALQAVNLRTNTPPRVDLEHLSKSQRASLDEIVGVLRAVCHAYKLPLALTWIPCSYSGGTRVESIGGRVAEDNARLSEKCVLCIEDIACYVNDTKMQGFVHACVDHYLEKGQGIAGKALQSNHPFFSPDVKSYDISDYPLVHHARKFGLNAAVAIRLRSTYTGNDDYILELFLPVDCKGSAEQQLLLNNLSSTMQKICRSLRTVSDAELVAPIENKVGAQMGAEVKFPSIVSVESSQLALSDNDLDSNEKLDLNSSDVRRNRMEADVLHEQTTNNSRRQQEKKRNTAEKTISLSVLQQYFSGSLKDAAKSIGVCPTTLKRICRQHGISRWPSRKINKVNRSLRKIQNVIDSVQGVEGRLKFDPVSGEFVTSPFPIQDFELRGNDSSSNKNMVPINKKSSSQGSIPISESEYSTVKLEDSECFMDPLQLRPIGNIIFSNKCKEEMEKDNNTLPSNCSDDSKFATLDTRSLQPSTHETIPWACSKDVSQISYFTKDISNKRENSDCYVLSPSSSSMDVGLDGDDGVIEHNQSSSSGMTDSSSGSGSMMNGSASSSPSFHIQNFSKRNICSGDKGSRITVKATYKEDTVRFKFEPNMGCLQLFEEVAKRFKLPTGTFQLKYLDDENEWVMLVSEADLQECLEIHESMGSNSVKLLVRDLPCAGGSSASSNCFLIGGGS